MDGQTAMNFTGPLIMLAMLAIIVVAVVMSQRRPAAESPGKPWNTRSLKLGAVGFVTVLLSEVLVNWLEVEALSDVFGLAILFVLVFGLLQGVADGLRGVRRTGMSARAQSWVGLLLVLVDCGMLWLIPR